MKNNRYIEAHFAEEYVRIPLKRWPLEGHTHTQIFLVSPDFNPDNRDGLTFRELDPRLNTTGKVLKRYGFADVGLILETGGAWNYMVDEDQVNLEDLKKKLYNMWGYTHSGGPAMSEYEGWLRCQGCGLGYNPESVHLKIPENEKHICPQCGSTELYPLGRR